MKISPFTFLGFSCGLVLKGVLTCIADKFVALILGAFLQCLGRLFLGFKDIAFAEKTCGNLNKFNSVIYDAKNRLNHNILYSLVVKFNKAEQVYVATQTSLCGNPNKFMWQPKQVYVAT
jgi:hypothetical protein